MSVGFTDREEAYYKEQGYICEESVLGKVYYKDEGIRIEGAIRIRYEEHPWISCFEVDGIRAKKDCPQQVRQGVLE